VKRTIRVSLYHTVIPISFYKPFQRRNKIEKRKKKNKRLPYTFGTTRQQYLNFSCNFQANIVSETCDRPRIQYELFWEGQTRHSPTFVQCSLTQPPATYEFLHLLLQATHAFYIMVVFNLKVSKPLNAFFDSAVS
jgi:hypothetical protein